MTTPDNRPQGQAPLAAGIDNIVNKLIFGIAIALIPISFGVFYFIAQQGWRIQFVLEIVAFVLIWLIAFSGRFLSPMSRATGITGLLTLAMLFEIYNYGAIGVVWPFLVTLPIIGAMIAGFRVGMAAMGVIVLALMGIAWVTITYQRVPPVNVPELFWRTDEWALRIFVFVVAGCVGIWLSSSFNRIYLASIEELRIRNAQLETSRDRVRHSAELAGLGYSITAIGSDKVLECDAAFAQMHGSSVAQVTGFSVFNDMLGGLVHPDDRARAHLAWQALRAGQPQTLEFRFRMQDGRYRTLRKIYSPLQPFDPDVGAFEVVCQDITDTRDAQEQLFQAQKMEAIGHLTGGVAHDFNNLLSVVLGNLELMQEVGIPDDTQEFHQAAVAATQRGAELTKSLLGFARKSSLEPTVFDLNQMAGEIKTWSTRVIPANITVEISSIGEPRQVEADPNLTQNAILNLILNARDAMPYGGTLRIETSDVYIDANNNEFGGVTVEPGDYVQLAVSDTGTGIAAKDLDKVFNPFWTTKDVGTGSGLGLSMVQGFMRQSGGTVHVVSDPDVGTTVTLYFRAVSAARAATSPKANEGTNPVSTGAKILVVEDEQGILDVLATILTKAGYQVVTASSGDAAYDLWRSGLTCDLVLTDLVMPGQLQGPQLAATLRETSPNLPIVFMSGYATDAIVANSGVRPEDTRLMKPVKRSDLIAAVEKALGVRAG